MSGARQVLAGQWHPPGYRHVHGPDLMLAIAFVAPYAALFVAFVLYPTG